MFGEYGLGKRIAVPYFDDLGKNRWDQKTRGELSFDDLDRITARRGDRPSRASKGQKEFDEIAVRTEPYRGLTNRVADALAMRSATAGEKWKQPGGSGQSTMVSKSVAKSPDTRLL